MNNFLTQKIFIPVSNFRRRQRAEMRPVFDFYQKGLRFRRESQNWNDAQKEKWILDALRFAVRGAATETVYSAELFRETKFDAAKD
ncbi:MAG: hypothetical protein ACR2GD_07100, partial [Pyrinomonadaceae bacterium]